MARRCIMVGGRRQSTGRFHSMTLDADSASVSLAVRQARLAILINPDGTVISPTLSNVKVID